MWDDRFLTVALTCISLVMSGVELLFMYLLVICMSSLEKCLFSASVHFKIRLFLVLFYYWVIWDVYVFWMSPLTAPSPICTFSFHWLVPPIIECASLSLILCITEFWNFYLLKIFWILLSVSTLIWGSTIFFYVVYYLGLKSGLLACHLTFTLAE